MYTQLFRLMMLALLSSISYAENTVWRLDFMPVHTPVQTETQVNIEGLIPLAEVIGGAATPDKKWFEAGRQHAIPETQTTLGNAASQQPASQEIWVPIEQTPPQIARMSAFGTSGHLPQQEAPRHMREPAGTFYPFWK